MDTASKMKVASAFGLTFFIIANFTNFFEGSSVLAGLVQLPINVAVFLSHKEGFRKYTGWVRAYSFLGIVGPIVTASITIWNVLIPALF